MSKLPIVAIIGLPNVGKSSLFNRLVGQRQAIVFNEPGTTRDPVQNVVEWGGKQFWLIDTAGLSNPHDELATDIQGQINEAQAAADLTLMVADATVPLSQKDRQLAKVALKSQKPLILAVNKIDATRKKLPEDFQRLGIKSMVGVSAIHSQGVEELLEAITTKIKLSQAKKVDLPPTIALLGRPNVGKSSLFNALSDTTKAVVSSVPGTTRDVNRVQLKYHGKKYDVLDTAGLRRAGKARGIEKISWLRTAQAINESDVCLLLLDATEPSVAVDQRIAGMVKGAGKGLVLVINKWDVVRYEDGKQRQLEALLQRDFAFAYWAPLVLVAATEGHNTAKLMEISQQILEKRQLKIRTSELNQLLQKALSAHPPAGLKNRHPKLNYVTQTGSSPPEFTLFGAHLNFLHWSYKRYLEKQLRETFDFTGTPITLIFKNKEAKREANRRPRQSR